MYRPVHSLLALLLLLCGSGAQCVPTPWPRFPAISPTAPRQLPEAPSKRQIIDVVNRNSALVQSYATNNATLTIAGLPPLKTRIALERPRRLRLEAGTGLTGSEIDLGSNDDVFWLWVRRSKPGVVLSCRHDQVASSSMRQVLPVEPQWLIDALGLLTFGPEASHSGPYQRPDGTLEIHSRWASPLGDRLKVTVVEEAQGWVLQQHLLTGDGYHLASAIASGHAYDRATGVSLPARIEVSMPPVGLSLKIDVGDYVINRPVGDARQLWSKPSYTGFTEVDLALVMPPETWSIAPPQPPPVEAAAPDPQSHHPRAPARWRRY